MRTPLANFQPVTPRGLAPRGNVGRAGATLAWIMLILPAVANFRSVVAAEYSDSKTGSHAGAVLAPRPQCEALRRYSQGIWDVYETRNFRLHHRAANPQAARSLGHWAHVAETTRAAVRQEWLDLDADHGWSPKCDVFLYPDRDEYETLTGYAAESMGYANLEIGSGKVWKRRLDLRADQADFHETSLPHEVTHVVLADRFHHRQIPRWSDEGIAVLVEPPRRKWELEAILAASEAAGTLFPVRDLLQMRHYPPERTLLFYAQSASLVEWLLERSSGPALVAFLLTAQTSGYEAALERHFQIAGVTRLEDQWRGWRKEKGRGNALAPAALVFSDPVTMGPGWLGTKPNRSPLRLDLPVHPFDALQRTP